MYRKAKNKCQWLKFSSHDRCNRNCIGEYCYIHNAQLKKAPGSVPCIKCGRGCRNKYLLSSKCGYHTAYVFEWRRKNRVIHN